MHYDAMPYEAQIYRHADEIDHLAASSDWEDDTPIRLDILIVYSAVIVRKLWSHYQSLYCEFGFDLNEAMSGLHYVNS